VVSRVVPKKEKKRWRVKTGLRILPFERPLTGREVLGVGQRIQFNQKDPGSNQKKGGGGGGLRPRGALKKKGANRRSKKGTLGILKKKRGKRTPNLP